MNPAALPPNPLQLPHKAQVISVRLSPSELESWGRPLQWSQVEPGVAFVALPASELPAENLPTEFERYKLPDGGWEVRCGEWSVRTAPIPAPDPGFVSGPIKQWRSAQGPWRGRSYIDSRAAAVSVSGEWLEWGAVRGVWSYQVRLAGGGSYSARMTFDVGSEFVRLDEEFSAGAGDQVVWDLSGSDLPVRWHRLDSSACGTDEPIQYHFDQRLGRLAAWTQFSQQGDYSDGFAVQFRGGDCLAWFTLEGGNWRGNHHNFVEAWTRRWWPGNAESRRLVPSEAKADSDPSPEFLPQQGGRRNEPHFSFEGWIHAGRRSSGLCFSEWRGLFPSAANPIDPLGHFESNPTRERYQREQGLLRRLHIRHGIFPRERHLALAFSWPQEDRSKVEHTPPWERLALCDFPIEEGKLSEADRVAGFHHSTTKFVTEGISPRCAQDRIEGILSYLEARIFGFWEGSGAAYTNAVVSRRIAPAMFEWEWLEAHGEVRPEQRAKGRASFAFLATLFASDHYYPGPATMGMVPGGEFEPTIQGMANQNFYTDVMNIPGVAAQIFPNHPDAGAWRERFGAGWRRQLEYHTYPASGVWEESHTYFHHVLHTVLPTLERRKRDGLEDCFADPVFQRVAGSLLELISPPDSFFGEERHTVPLGDHGVESVFYRPLYRAMTELFADAAPRLAAEFAWAYREMGGRSEVPIPAREPAWKDAAVEGLGFFFRGRRPEGDTLLVLRSGRSWGHHHHDEGSLQWYAAGRAWLVDSAFGYRQKSGQRKFSAAGHSRWTPEAFAPLNYRWRLNRGWIESAGERNGIAYATAFTPVFMAEMPWRPGFAPLTRPILHWRTVVQVAPLAFLVVDESDWAVPSTVRFHTPTLEHVELGLRIRVVSGSEPPILGEKSVPTEVDESFSTTEWICWAERRCALLVSVEGAGEEWEVAEGRLRGVGGEFVFSWQEGSGFVLDWEVGNRLMFNYTTNPETALL